MEKLKVAILYGADAVYLGGESFGLRSIAGNFSIDEMDEALRLCHEKGVKAYLTVNSYPADSLLDSLGLYLRQVSDLPFDAYIISDPGVLRMVRRITPERAVHLSTQANCINHEAALFWQEQGVSRINLAREMNIDEIRRTVKTSSIECEVFIHGALCVAYSGRCLISSVLTGRSANMGACTQPCRWKYNLVEETRPGEFMPVEEDENGTLIFNSRDLCLLEYLPDLIEAGVASMKIEGRMKGVHYLAGVLRVYRAAIDSYCSDPSKYSTAPPWMEELTKVSHRGYTTGFLLGDPKDVGQFYENGYRRTHTIVGVVEDTPVGTDAVVAVRNRFRKGEFTELLGPGMKTVSFCPETFSILNPDGTAEPSETANPNQRIRVKLPESAEAGDLLRVTGHRAE